MNKPAKRILLAVRPTDLTAVANFLGDEFDVVIVHRYDEAIAALNKEIGLIACGVHFDEGMLFELLNVARSHPATQSTPFYVLFKPEPGYSQPIIDGVRRASKLLGASEFIDLLQMVRDLGEAGAQEAIRQGIRDILGSDSLPAVD